jgi:hypothetical protein
MIFGVTTLLAVHSWRLAAIETGAKESPASGSFVSFSDGKLTLRGKAGLITFEQVGANYQTFENNEDGPGSRLVDTVSALGKVTPGAVFQVNVPEREILFGLDHRVIGRFESYQEGKLILLPAEVPPGFVPKPAGKVALTIDPGIPVLESVNAERYHYAGPAGEFLKTVKPGTLLTARSESDIDHMEVIQIGEPKQKIERYIGQTRGTVRGTFVSFKDGILRVRGKGVTSLAANEYERLIAFRIGADIPIFESLDGEAYQPAGVEALRSAREGTVVTVRKVEEVILEVQIGMAKRP